LKGFILSLDRSAAVGISPCRWRSPLEWRECDWHKPPTWGKFASSLDRSAAVGRFAFQRSVATSVAPTPLKGFIRPSIGAQRSAFRPAGGGHHWSGGNVIRHKTAHLGKFAWCLDRRAAVGRVACRQPSPHGLAKNLARQKGASDAMRPLCDVKVVNCLTAQCRWER